MNQTIQKFIAQFYGELLEYRKRFHAIAEPSYKEFKTSQLIQQELGKLGIPYKTVGETAVIAEIGSGLPVVGARFNMDGLEGCVEHTNLEHSAVGNCAHACGHDVELAWAMGIARFFSQEKFDGTIRLIFQPAEEGPNDNPQGYAGGRFLAELGAFDGLNSLFSFHVDPDMELGEVCAHDGVATVDAIDFEFHFKGLSSHLSRPGEGVNPRNEFAKTILAIDTLVSNITDLASESGNSPFLILDISQASMGLNVQSPFKAEINTLPNEAILRGSSRMYDGNDSRSLKNSVVEGLKAIADDADRSLKEKNAGCGCTLLLNSVAIATVNDAEVVAHAAQAITGSGLKHLTQVKYWKDEAGWTSEKAAVCHGYVGCGKGSRNLHSSDFYPDEKVLEIGLRVFIGSILNATKATDPE